MFEEKNPLHPNDTFKTYRRVHARNLIDDTKSRVKRDVIHEFDTWKDRKGEYIRNSWVEIYPWEKFENLLNNICTYVRLKDQYFIDQKSFDVNNPRDINIYDFIKKMVDNEPHKSGFTKFMDSILGRKTSAKSWFADEQERIAKLLKEGDVAVEKDKETPQNHQEGK